MVLKIEGGERLGGFIRVSIVVFYGFGVVDRMSVRIVGKAERTGVLGFVVVVVVGIEPSILSLLARMGDNGVRFTHIAR